MLAKAACFFLGAADQFALLVGLSNPSCFLQDA
jgi:hypothetical protein